MQKNKNDWRAALQLFAPNDERFNHALSSLIDQSTEHYERTGDERHKRICTELARAIEEAGDD